MVTINDFRLKIVVSFEHPSATLTQVTNFFNNNIKPDIQTALIAKLDANFDPGYTLGYKNKITEPETQKFEIYPKLFFSGTTTLTKAQLRTGLDATLDDIKTFLNDEIITQGGTNVKFHIHKSTGDVDE